MNATSQPGSSIATDLVTKYVPNFLNTSSLILRTLSILIIFLVPLLLLSNYRSHAVTFSSRRNVDGSYTVPRPPLWRPIVGHVFDMLNPNSLLRGTRDKLTSQGLFSISLVGNTYNMIYSPSLVSAIFAQRSSVVDFHDIVWQILSRVGGVSNRWKDVWHASFHDLTEVTIKHMMREPALSRMIDVYMLNFCEALPNLVSFAPAPIDQSTWERTAKAQVVEGGEAVEVDLVQLILHFVGTNSQPALMGREFFANNPGFLEDLLTFNHAFMILAAGVPAWFPMPALMKGVPARERMFAAITTWHEAVCADTEGQPLPQGYDDMSDVSAVMRERVAVEKKYGLPSHVAAVADMSIAWALHANSNFAAFWTLARILADRELAHEVRQEVQPFVKITKHADVFVGVKEQLRVDIDHRRLSTECTLLRACFIESMRLDSAPWSIRKILADFRVTETQKEADGFGVGGKRTWQLRKGEFVTVPFDVHFTDPKVWDEPSKFKPERHIVEDGGKDGQSSAEWTSVRPFGGGASMCKGRMFAEREVLASIAGILAMWDIEPVAGEWRVPAGDKATGVNMPRNDIRVRLRQRRGVQS